MADTSTPTRFHLRLLAIFAAFAVLLAACGASESRVSGTADTATDAADDAGEFENISRGLETESDSDEDAVADDEADDASSASATTIAPSSNSDDLGTGGNNASQQTPADLGREIIFTARINVGVDDVAASGAEATQIIQDLDGFVFGQETTGGARPVSILVFKVRPTDFATALERLGGIGELRNQTITTDDVTERVVDLQGRITTTELGVIRLRTAMENTTNLEDFARLEEQLLRRESDLEVLKGTLRTLRDQIDLATITLTLEQDRVANGMELRFTSYEGHDNGAGCPGIEGNRFDPDDELTLCFEVVNVGDQTLTDLSLSDTVLEIDGTDDLITVFGDPDDIQPGQSVVLGYEMKADRNVNLRLTVTATPTNGTSTEAAGPTVRSQLTPQILVDESAADPGFGDGFGAATELLSGLWTAVKVIAGFLIPLLVLLPFFALAWFAVRGLARRSKAKANARWESAQRPPPAPAAASTATTAASSTDSADDEPT